MGNYNTRWGMIIATIALGIKLSKDWWLQQQENLEILRKKARAEIQLQKALFHPGLFIRSLNTIYTNIQSGSEKAPGLILHLSDLLSYSIYESDSKLVSLEKELYGLQNLIALEKQHEKYSIEILLPTEKEIHGKLIAPGTIVKLFEEIISLLHDSDVLHSEITLEIAIANNTFSLNLTFTGLPEKALSNSRLQLLIKNTGNKLNESYNKTDYEVKLATDKNRASIRLNLKLTDCTNEINITSKIKLTAADYDNA